MPANVPAAPPAPAPALAPQIAPDGRVYAVISTVELYEECSGLGGEHYVFAVDDPTASAPALVHAGGHGVHLGLLPPWGARPVRWFVAELSNLPRTSEDHDGNPDSSVQGWCLDAIGPTQGEALRVVAAEDRDAARRLLATIAATGLPRQQATARAATGPTALASVRVRERPSSQADAFAVDVLAGAAAAVLELPTRADHEPFDEHDLAPWTGDVLVVELDAAGQVTRALIADTVDDARRWQAAITSHGWPAQPIVTGWIGGAAITRWSAVGTVATGNQVCGLELRLDDWDGSRFSIAPPKVAAPSSASIGDRVTAVVVPQPRDHCGRTARIVRAWVTPGVDRARWVIDGTAAPSPPLVP